MWQAVQRKKMMQEWMIVSSDANDIIIAVADFIGASEKKLWKCSQR